MDNLVLVAIISGGIALLNGPILISFMNRHWKKNDDLKEIQGNIEDLRLSIERIGDGLNIGLENDKVIFKAFREHCINGESEAQERRMDAYLTRCTIANIK